MSVKVDPNGRRSIQVEVEVPGTPEQVWEAIATGPGVSAWFVPCEMDHHVGGKIVSHFGPGMDAVATITEWEPNRRFAAESSYLGPNGPTMATEWIVEARSGGTCVVRVVHSMFASTDDWDDQLTSVESGWPGFFRILRLYLAHFRGLPSASFQLVGFSHEPDAQAWQSLTAALGLSSASEGAPFAAAGDTPPLAGAIESVKSEPGCHAAFVRLDTPGPGTAMFGAHLMGDKVYMMGSYYFYGEDAAAVVAREESRWQAWMSATFPVAESAPAS